MALPLVEQLKFSRAEFVRGLAGITAQEATHRFEPLNCLSWMIGHMANQENAYWVYLAQGKRLHPELRELVGTGRPASAPPLDEMWQAWREVTAQADKYLDDVGSLTLLDHFQFRGEAFPESIGTLLMRNIYHYWYHTGEAAAVRQMLGHHDLPEFVGDLSSAPYRPPEA